MNKRDITNTMEKYNLRDCVVMAGAAMVMHGIREETNDIDVWMCPAALIEFSNYHTLVVENGHASFNELDFGPVNDEDACGPEYVMIDGWMVQSLNSIVELKTKLGR